MEILRRNIIQTKISKLIKQYIPRKMIKMIGFSWQINLTIGKRPKKKNIETFNLTRKLNFLMLWRGKKSYPYKNVM